MKALRRQPGPLLWVPLLAASLLVLMACRQAQPMPTPTPVPPTPTTIPSTLVTPTPTPEAVAPASPTPATMAPVTPTPAVKMGPVVKVVEVAGLGEVLADSQGRVLYLFLKDEKNKSNCSGYCVENWPPLLTEGIPRAGEGVDAMLLGTTTREGGDKQVTYNGWPLYYFAGDQAPGQANGQGVLDAWYVVSPRGEPVKGPQAQATPTPAAPAPTPMAPPTPTAPVEVVEVDIQDFAFSPDTITVTVGTRVVWTNQDPVSHTVTADDGSWDSGTLRQGESFSRVFDTPGEYTYYCTIHPYMKGKVVVKEATTTGGYGGYTPY